LKMEDYSAVILRFSILFLVAFELFSRREPIFTKPQ